MKPSFTMLRRIHAINRVAPVVCIACLIGSGVLLARGTAGDRAQATARAHVIRTSLADVPYIGGDWVGTDCALPAGATEILMPTAVLSRRFAEMGTGRRATLGIIHCGDVRDMHGHYPPACYPSSGWHPRESGHDMVRLSLGGEPFESRLYRFSLVDGSGMLHEVSVIGFFVLPDGTLGSDMELLRSRAAKSDISRMGVGQIQVVMDGWPPADEVAAVADQLLGLVPQACVRALRGLPDNEAEVRARPKDDGHVKLQGISAASPRGSREGGDQ
jgi:hypothetical protein